MTNFDIKIDKNCLKFKSFLKMDMKNPVIIKIIIKINRKMTTEMQVKARGGKKQLSGKEKYCWYGE